jgi:hypothetical protein
VGFVVLSLLEFHRFQRINNHLEVVDGTVWNLLGLTQAGKGGTSNHEGVIGLSYSIEVGFSVSDIENGESTALMVFHELLLEVK